MYAVQFAFALAVLAGVADIGANLAANASNGFRKRSWGWLSILLVLVTFALLGQAVQSLDLAIAYACWARQASSALHYASASSTVSASNQSLG